MYNEIQLFEYFLLGLVEVVEKLVYFSIISNFELIFNIEFRFLASKVLQFENFNVFSISKYLG